MALFIVVVVVWCCECECCCEEEEAQSVEIRQRRSSDNMKERSENRDDMSMLSLNARIDIKTVRRNSDNVPLTRPLYTPESPQRMYYTLSFSFIRFIIYSLFSSFDTLNK
jgi:hypothetical protein